MTQIERRKQITDDVAKRLETIGYPNIHDARIARLEVLVQVLTEHISALLESELE